MKIYFSIILLLILSISCSASVFVVNSAADTSDLTSTDGLCLDASGNCTLRAAVEQANALASDDIIVFVPTVNLITLSTQIVINNNGSLQIIGNGANVLTIKGGGTNRLFYANSAAFSISAVSLTGGNSIENRDGGAGGAIFANSGNLSVSDSYIFANNGTGGASQGGGICTQNGTSMVIKNSTISNNSAGSCTGVSSRGQLFISNTTISGNNANGGGDGGGLCVIADPTYPATLRNVTITNNFAINDGGGIYLVGTLYSSINFKISNSIIAGNSSLANPEIYISAPNLTITSEGNNLIGDSTGKASQTNAPITYQPTDILDTPPMFGTLQNNGGTTPTHALLTGSPAIDKGNNALAVDPSTNQPLLFDQRGAGFPRTTDGDGDQTAAVDIGAYEKPLGVTAASATVSGRIANPKGRGVFRALVVLTNQNGEVKTSFTNPFGYYFFKDVEVGQSYILTVEGKQFTFAPQVLFVGNDLSDLNFTVK